MKRSKHEINSLLITTSTLPVRTGDGVPRFVIDLAIALQEKFDVTVVTPHSLGAARSESTEGVSVRRFKYFWPESMEKLSQGGVISSNLGSGWTWLLVPFLLVAGTVATVRHIRHTQCVAVNAHWLVPMGLCTAFASLLTRVPMLLHVHAGDVYLLRRIPFGGMVAKLVVRRASCIFADGSHVRDTLDHLIGRPSGAILRPMGVWVEHFKPSGEAPDRLSNSVVFVGRLVEKKGVPYLLKAIAQLTTEIPDITLDIIGSGPLEDDLRRRTDELGLGNVVSFVGPLAHKDVVTYLHRASVGCVPSIIDSKGETEGMPTVVVEAMASGLRVVGSDVDGIPDVLEDQTNGWLARPADSEDLASKLRAALVEENDAISHQAQVDAEVHDWSRVADQYAMAVWSVSRG